MKRVYFPICLSLLSMNGLVAAAQDAQPATRTVVMYGGPNQILTNVSSNGKWACGAQTDGLSDPIGFIWNLESNEITTLGVNTAAYAVSDNGVVVGTFLDSELRATARLSRLPDIGLTDSGITSRTPTTRSRASARAAVP